MEGYEHDVVDYLLKPVSFERFYKAVEKAGKIISPPAQAAAPAQGADPASLFVKTEHRLQRIDIPSILYIEARQNYVVIVTPEAQIMSLQSIKSMEEKLPASTFMRIHKSIS